jgi:hypothetical protein
MIIDATGVALINTIAGAANSSIRLNRAENAARITPEITARKKPEAIREEENSIDCQKSAFVTSSAKLSATEPGDARSISRLI